MGEPRAHPAWVLALRAWRRFPWPGGRGRDRVKQRLVRGARPPRPVPTAAGWLLLENGDDTLERHLLAVGHHWETRVEDLITANRAALAGATVIDVGGHVGYYAVLLAHLVGPEGRVVVLEARPELCDRIDWARDRNHLPWLTVVRGAAAAEPGPLALGLDGDAGHSTAAVRAGVPTVTVDGVRLDDVAAAEHLATPRLVMMDIEGGEAGALAGMAGLLAADDPPDLLLEVHPEQLLALGTSQEELLDGLRADGRYDLHVVDHHEGVHPLTVPPAASSWHLLAVSGARRPHLSARPPGGR